MKHTDESIMIMIDDCLNVIHIPKSRGGPGFNSWEIWFIESVDEQYHRNVDLYNCHGLTDRQIEKLEQIWNKV